VNQRREAHAASHAAPRSTRDIPRDTPREIRGGEAADEPTDFAALGLREGLLRAIREAGHTTPTTIQARAIPAVLAGRDLLGCAQTGTGKTAAFALPMLQLLSARSCSGERRPAIRALVLSPTRELATQIGRSFDIYGRHTGLRQLVLFGGVSEAGQIAALRRGVDILVATPGRLCDLLERGCVQLGAVEIMVLDEADRMLDEGFLPAVRRVLKHLPAVRQTLFFSATMPPEIRPLAAQVLRDPLQIEVSPVASTPDRVEQSVYLVDQGDKRALLRHVLDDGAVDRAIVFTRTRHGASRVAVQLARAGVSAEAIHGDKSQNARERTLARFRSGALRVLVATDVAARGIDVRGVTHVVNFDMPVDPEAYVHRIGRTARAGLNGTAISFCSGDERPRLSSIERLIRRRLSIVSEHPYAPAANHAAAPRTPAPAAPGRNGGPGPRRAAGRRGPAGVAAPRSHRPLPGQPGRAGAGPAVTPRREPAAPDRRGAGASTAQRSVFSARDSLQGRQRDGVRARPENAHRKGAHIAAESQLSTAPAGAGAPGAAARKRAEAT
jgi:ATP-dependent RNA helicase RhlE